MYVNKHTEHTHTYKQESIHITIPIEGWLQRYLHSDPNKQKYRTSNFLQKKKNNMTPISYRTNGGNNVGTKSSTAQFIFSLKHTSLFMIRKIWGLGSICLVRTAAALMILSDNLTLKGQLHGPDMNNKKPTKGSFARKGCNTPPAADNRYMSFLCSVSSPFKLYRLLAWRRWREAAVASVGFAVHRLDGRGSAGERLKLQFLYLGYGSGMTARKAKKKKGRTLRKGGWGRQKRTDAPGLLS